MANIIIPEKSDEKVSDLMGFMGFTSNKDRPIVLRIALSKGIIHSNKDSNLNIDSSKGREIPLKTLCPGDNYLFVKHSIIQKHEEFISDEDLTPVIKKYLILGIDIMHDEINKLDQLDNYLIYLAESVNNKNDQEKIKDLLGF
ncbi:hypothetical protein ACFFJI_11550 [Allobacillus sp. GCM10007491]|uniref:Uncharacterized protein n=1 Tax=Allobacillus saliphilus TaxID=2912308 RepID=A0A941CW32_9BACI|nr:hypothetical protein [Allobacillus saliphilus]MBR7553621.1 hypothetical protein [Allobacillus saliphilus]